MDSTLRGPRIRIRRLGQAPVILEFPPTDDPFKLLEYVGERLNPEASRSDADISAQAERDKRFEALMTARNEKRKPEWLRPSATPKKAA